MVNDLLTTTLVNKSIMTAGISFYKDYGSLLGWAVHIPCTGCTHRGDCNVPAIISGRQKFTTTSQPDEAHYRAIQRRGARLISNLETIYDIDDLIRLGRRLRYPLKASSIVVRSNVRRYVLP